MSELLDLARSRDFCALKARLARASAAELSAAWAEAAVLERLTLFKLLEPRAALAFFESLDLAGRYLVFSGYDHGAVAPLFEGRPGDRALLHRLPEGSYDSMLRALS